MGTSRGGAGRLRTQENERDLRRDGRLSAQPPRWLGSGSPAEKARVQQSGHHSSVRDRRLDAGADPVHLPVAAGQSGVDHLHLRHPFLHAGAAGAELRSGAGQAQLFYHQRAASFRRSVAVLLFPVFRKAELLAAVSAAGPGVDRSLSGLPPAEAA